MFERSRETMPDWIDRVVKPVALGEEGKQIEAVLDTLLHELKTNSKIETVYTQTERDKLLSTLKTLDITGLAYNTMRSVFKERAATFQDAMSKFDFDEKRLIHIYIALGVTIALLSTELFKLLLLFHMKDVDHNVSNFMNTVSKAAPRIWPKLQPFVDNNFRNALAHGTYAVMGKKVVLFKDAKLLPSEEMTLREFFSRIKNQSILYQCLINILNERMKPHD